MEIYSDQVPYLKGGGKFDQFCQSSKYLEFSFLKGSLKLSYSGVVEPRGGQVVIHVDSVRQDAALLRVQEAEKTRSRSNI